MGPSLGAAGAVSGTRMATGFPGLPCRFKASIPTAMQRGRSLA